MHHPSPPVLTYGCLMTEDCRNLPINMSWVRHWQAFLQAHGKTACLVAVANLAQDEAHELVLRHMHIMRHVRLRHNVHRAKQGIASCVEPD